MLILIAAIVLPVVIGFAIPFFSPGRARQLLWALTITPGIALSLSAMALSSRAISLSDVSILGLLICLAVLFAILGRAFGKPFAQIWQEHKDKQIQETFR